jgi:hypothetical protein
MHTRRRRTVAPLSASTLDDVEQVARRECGTLIGEKGLA